MNTSAKSTSAANALEAMIQQTLNESDYARSARRLILNGTVTDSTTFADLDDVLKKDIEQRAAIEAIKRYFDRFPASSYTIDEGNRLIRLAYAWLLIDPEDFLETFCTRQS